MELIKSNSKFSNVHFKDGKECTISTEDLAPKPFQRFASDSNGLQTSVPNDNTEIEIPTNLDEQQPEIISNPPLPDELQNATEEICQTNGMLSQPTTPDPRHKLRLADRQTGRTGPDGRCFHAAWAVGKSVH